MVLFLAIFFLYDPVQALADPYRCVDFVRTFVLRKSFRFVQNVKPGAFELRESSRMLRLFPKRNINRIPAVLDFTKKHPVHISLTTSPERLMHVPDVIDQLDLEHVQEVAINVPSVFRRTGQKYPEIPESLRLHPKVKIYRVAHDDGPATKILPAIKRLRKTQPNAYVISIDDDTGYPIGMVNELIYQASNHPNAVLNTAGGNYFHWGIQKGKSKDAITRPKVGQEILESVDVVEGFSGVIYPVKGFPVDQVESAVRSCDVCRSSDDLVLSYYLQKNGFPLLSVQNRYLNRKMIFQFDYGFQKDALHRIQENTEKYQQTFQFLERSE